MNQEKVLYSISATFKNQTFYLKTGEGSVPNRTILSSSLIWVTRLERTKMEAEQSMKWMNMLMKQLSKASTITIEREWQEE